MKTALITGSTKGIGKQIGLDLLDKNYFVYFNGHTEKSCNELKLELDKKHYYQNRIIKQDCSEIDFNVTMSTIEPLDVLVLNIGITDRTPFGKITIDNWQKVFDANLTVPFFLVQSLKNKMKSNGKIIFISSISGCTTDSTSIAYGVSKGAIHVLVPYLAKEFTDKKVTVNAIAPGYIDTSWHKDKSKAQIKRIEKKHLMDRLGTAKEISKAVLSIIENDFINAQVIRVDGGFGLL